MKGLTDYVHSLGLHTGIYSSPGPYTCAGYEGSYAHEAQDAKTYAVRLRDRWKAGDVVTRGGTIVDRQALLVAVAIADQVGAAMASTSPPAFARR